MNLCISCMYCSIRLGDAPEFAKCLSPRNLEGHGIDPVTGDPQPLYRYCHSHRITETAGCTREGKWWVASFWAQQRPDEIHDDGDPPWKDPRVQACLDASVPPYGAL